jgi:hypothetical protein
MPILFKSTTNLATEVNFCFYPQSQARRDQARNIATVNYMHLPGLDAKISVFNRITLNHWQFQLSKGAHRDQNASRLIF